MPSHTRISLADPEAWASALQGLPYAFAHTWNHCHAIHLTTGVSTFLYSFAAGDVRIVCPLAERTIADAVDIVTPYGFAGFVGNHSCEQFPDHWQHFVAEQGYVCGYISLNPLFEQRSYYRPTEVFRHNELFILDLTLSHDQLWRNLAKNRARNLKQWNQSDATLIRDKDLLTEFFLAQYDDFFQSRNAAAVYRFTKATLAALLNAPDTLLIGAGRAGHVEAVTLFGYTPHAADFLFNVSLPDGQQHSAGLLWYGFKELKALGIPCVNLGGGIRENDGVAEFKRRFGGSQLPLTALKQIYRSERYAELCRRSGVDPKDRSGYFPAYRSPASVSQGATSNEEQL
ncbi:MAG: hypothetical protein AB4911_24365 [Oscillochloridaceae bacterium umkhey_bin13]